MYPATINRRECITLFETIVQRNSQKRILLIKGEEGMGKTHLLASVFKVIAENVYHAHCINIDLKLDGQTIYSIIANARKDLGDKGFFLYHIKSLVRRRNPNQIVMDNIYMVDSQLTASIIDDSIALNYQRQILDQTTFLMRDISRLSKQVLVFFIDNANVKAVSKETLEWLVNTFLKQLSKESHVRIVMAGSSLPEVHLGYLSLCESCDLSEVRELEAYMTYCENAPIKFGEEAIEAIAIISDHRPGFFVNNIRKVTSFKQASQQG
jgi:hypothetical protein